MHLDIRLANRGDLEGLAALYAQLRPNDPLLIGTHIERVLDELSGNPNIRLLVGEIDNTLASTCMLGIVPNLAHGGRPFGIIEQVVTLASHRRKGYSREVLAQALTLAWNANCYKVMLLSGMKLKPAHSLYESLGFNGDVERGFVAKPEFEGRHSR